MPGIAEVHQRRSQNAAERALGNRYILDQVVRLANNADTFYGGYRHVNSPLRLVNKAFWEVTSTHMYAWHDKLLKSAAVSV